MKKRCGYSLYFLLWFFSLPFVQAQEAAIHFEKLSTDDGLSSNFVNSIAQDQRGFIWISTINGLNRYDGYSFSTFWHDPNDSTSISGDWGQKIFLDSRGTLWVGTHCCGLNRFDYETESFTRFQHDPEDPLSISHDIITTIHEDTQQTLWIGTTGGGLNRFDRRAQTFYAYRHDENNAESISDNNVRAIYEDRKGNFWVGTGGPGPTTKGGLNRFDRNTGIFIRYLSDPGDPGTLIDNRVWALCEDHTGTFWVGTWGDGLHIMDREKESFTRLRYNPDQPESLSQPHLKREDPADPGFGPGITFIHQDHANRLWIGAFLGGLNRFDIESGEIKHYEANRESPNGLESNWIRSFYEDRQQNLWMGTAGDGIYKILPGKFELYKRPLEGANVQAIFEDEYGTIWIGTGKGLFRFDKSSQAPDAAFTQVGVPASLLYGSITAITEADENRLWFGTTNGLFQWIPASGRVFHYEADSIAGLSDKHIVALARSKKVPDALWVATQDDGLHFFDVINNRFIGYDIQVDSTISEMYSQHTDNNVTALYADNSDKLWIGTNAGGFLRWDPSTQETEFFLPDFLYASCFYEDTHGRFWIASGLHGLIQFDPDKGQVVKRYMEKDGLISSRLQGILEDTSGFLWLSGNDGSLSRFDPETGMIRSFDAKDGLQRNHYLINSFAQAYTGEFLFGGYEGITVFNAENFAPNPYPADPVITKVRVNGEPKIVGGKMMLELLSEENDLDFEFAALHFIRPEYNQILRKLEGYDQHWRTPINQGISSYTNLDPGSYIFKVKAASSDGVWSEDIASLQILIHPPWWRTWWAYLLYVTGLLALLYLAYDYQRRRWAWRTSLQLEQDESRRLREMNEFKSRLYSNITHEFRTPLTVIRGLTRELKDSPGKNQREYTELIDRNSANLLTLVNQMLDLSKLEAGRLVPKYQQGDSIKYLEYLIESFHSLAYAHRINLSFYAHQESLRMDYDPEKLQQILSNLISNSLKFTPEYGKIRVIARLVTEPGDQNWLEVEVQDSGPGIPNEQLPYIFDRFYQGDNSNVRRAEGTGIGLSLVKELVELMEGNVRAENVVGQGCRFIFRLPVRRTAEWTSPQEDSIVQPISTGAALSLSKKLPSPLPDQDKPQILIVEDNRDVIYYLQKCLQGLYRINIARNGREGIDQAVADIPDLIISDIMMPEVDGYELCRIIRADERTNHIPIILLTAKVEQEDKLEGLSRGADAYLSKPFQREELLIRIEKLIELRARLQAKYQNREPEAEAIEDPFLQKVRETVVDRLDDAEFGVMPLSRALGMSRVQVHRKLKALTGLSTTELIRTIRLQRARELLLNSDLHIAEIAYQVGFKDPAHFSRTFSRYYECAPSELRR